jgi:hypothetical protein
MHMHRVWHVASCERRVRTTGHGTMALHGKGVLGSAAGSTSSLEQDHREKAQDDKDTDAHGVSGGMPLLWRACRARGHGKLHGRD